MLVAVTFSFTGCRKDILEKDLALPSRYYTLNEIEKRFFNPQNITDLLSSGRVSGRSAFPEALMRVYNDMLAHNDVHHFVISVVERIGYPLWESAMVEENYDGSIHLVNIPFVKPGVTNTQAILTCLVSELQGDILYGIKSKKDLDAVLEGAEPIATGTCRDCIDFGVFNYAIFGEQGELYEDLTCDACFPETDGDNIRDGHDIVARSCVTIEITYCIWDEPNGPLTASTDGGYGGDDRGWFVWSPGLQPGSFIFFGPVGGNTGGSAGTGGHPNLRPWLDAIGEFFKNLFTSGPKCPKFTAQSPGSDIVTRTSEGEFVCQTFTSIMCFNGDWWEVVESWPCPECDGNLTLEEYHGMLCSENTLEFLAACNISTGILKKYGINLGDCCSEGEFDEECGVGAVLEGVGLSVNSQVVECVTDNLPLIHVIVQLMTSNLFDPCNPHRTAAEMLQDALTAGCGNGVLSKDELFEIIAEASPYYEYLLSIGIDLVEFLSLGIEVSACCNDFEFTDCLDELNIAGRMLCLEPNDLVELTDENEAFYVNFSNMGMVFYHQGSGATIQFSYDNICLQVNNHQSRFWTTKKMILAWELAVETTASALDFGYILPTEISIREGFKLNLRIQLGAWFGGAPTVGTGGACLPGIPSIPGYWNCDGL